MTPIELLYEERPATLPAAAGAALRRRAGTSAPVRLCQLCRLARRSGHVATGGRVGQTISGGSEADRLVMALLRAPADAVLIGAGTFRRAPGHRWHAETIFPELAAYFAAIRAGRPPPPLVVVTESGAIDLSQPALEDAIVVTTSAGEARLRGRLPASTRLIVGAISLRRSPNATARAGLRRDSYRRVGRRW